MTSDFGNIEIGLGKNYTDVDLCCDVLEVGIEDVQPVIDTNPPPIEIEITGLKTVGKFIGLEDTPLYYDNGKFFKVENNRIVYTDIKWEDIQGKIEDNPDLQEQITEIVKQYSKTYVEDAVKENIDIHNEDVNAHPSIQKNILDNYTDLSAQISGNYIELNNSISDVKNTADKNSEDISILSDEIGNVVQELNDLVVEVTTNTENIDLLDTNLDLLKIDVVNNTENINKINQDLVNYVKTNDLGKVAFSDDYNDLINLPDIPSIEGLASEEWVNQRISDTIGQITSFEFIIVDELPERGEAGRIYLVPHQHSDKDIYDEYIWIEENNSFELIGNTDIDLSNYYTKDETNILLEDKQNVLTAGEGISIENNIVTNTRDTVEWGKITGDILNQLDLQENFTNINTNIEENKKDIEDLNVSLNNLSVNTDERIQNLTENKADKSNTLAGYGIEDAYTKDEVYSKDETYQQSEINTLLDTKVDKVEGKSLISDTEIERLTNVYNYDDTEIRETKQDKLTAGEGISIENNVISGTTVIFRDWSVQ